MTGEIGILNVGAGDTKLTFDKANPAERIRAARIVTDMLRRGYALLIEVPGVEGPGRFRRVTAFDEEACEYIIADLDPVAAEKYYASEEGKPNAQGNEPSEDETSASASAPISELKTRRGGRSGGTRRIPAERTSGVAVSRTAGG